MSYIENTIAVLCGGAAGAVCRFKLNAAIMSGLTLAFPLGILCINVLGGFLMGLLQGAMKRSGKPFTVGYSLLGTGFLGGFSTFSTMMNETVTLLRKGEIASFAGYFMASVVVPVVAVACGYCIIA